MFVKWSPIGRYSNFLFFFLKLIYLFQIGGSLPPLTLAGSATAQLGIHYAIRQNLEEFSGPIEYLHNVLNRKKKLYLSKIQASIQILCLFLFYSLFL